MRILRHELWVPLVLTLLLLCATAGKAAGHPCESYTPNDLPAGYGSSDYILGPAGGINELTFSCPYPDPSTLTDLEKYMIAGCAGTDELFLQRAWTDELARVLAIYTDKFGELPEYMGEEVINGAISNVDELSVYRKSVYRSPLTGMYPRLNADYFSPGDVYARKLTAAEIEQLVVGRPQLEDVLLNGVFRPDPASDQYIEVKSITGPLYIKVYGWSGVILEEVYFNFSAVQ